jgi:hypothetical protein
LRVLKPLCSIKSIQLLTVALALAAGSATAQTGTVTGSITDPSGAAVVGAVVSAQNLATGTEIRLLSNEAGLVAMQLPPGDYKITATAPGFQPVSRPKVTVDALSSISLEFQLAVGATSTELTVEAGAVVVQSENATLGTTMRNDVYGALPLAMSQGVPRDPTAFIALAPGVAAVVLQSAGPSRTSFNGAQQENNGLYLEGVAITLGSSQGDTRPVALGVSVDAVNQFQVEINGQKASYQGQGFHNYVIKSGTNQFHGTAFEYLRNTVLDARGFFSPFVPSDRQNEFGGNLGGRVIKDKLFFFGNYDGYIFHTSTAPTVLSIPSLPARAGNFSALPVAIYDPQSQTCQGVICSKTQFPGNIIPANRLSRAALSFQSYLPNPTSSGFVNNYIQPLARAITNYNTTDKVDYNINEKHHLYGIFGYGQWKTDYTGNLTPTGTALPLPYTQTPGIVVERPWITQIHENYLVSASLLNSFTVAMTRLSIPIYPVTADGQYPQKAGLTGLPSYGQAASGFPGINFGGTDAPSNWAGTGPFSEWETNWAVQDSLQWVHGNHVLSFGGQLSTVQDNSASPTSGTSASFSFSNTETAGYSATGTVLSTTGNSYASYLVGAVSSASITSKNIAEVGGRYKNFSFFAQDDWKIHRRLTLNLGLRWDVFRPYHEAAGRSTYFSPAVLNPSVENFPGALVYGGQPINTHWRNFQPRVGLAYSFDSKTVFRAGFVLSDTLGAPGTGGSGIGGGPGQTGLNPPTAIASAVTGLPAFYWDQGVPIPVSPTPLANAGFGAGNTVINPTGAVSVSYVNPSLAGRSPYYINWSGGLERQMPWGVVLGTYYSASVGHFLVRSGDNGIWTNSMLPKYLALGGLLTAQATPANMGAAQTQFPEIRQPFSTFSGTIAAMLRPFPQYGAGGSGGISCFSCTLGNSTYNSLQIFANRRAAENLTLQFAYTFSKEIDNLPNGGQLGVIGGTRNPYDGHWDRGLGAIDHPHNLHLTAVYLLPFATKGQIGGNNAAVRAVFGGWTVSGIYTYSTGSPLGITASGCTTPGLVATCMPNYASGFSDSAQSADWGSGNVLAPGARSYLVKAAFVDPAPYTIGNVARSAPYGLRAPTLWNLDMAVRKKFRLREMYQLELVGDFFNIFNAVVFAAPGTNIDNANFGQLTAAQNAPRKIQVSARFTF